MMDMVDYGMGLYFVICFHNVFLRVRKKLSNFMITRKYFIILAYSFVCLFVRSFNKNVGFLLNLKGTFNHDVNYYTSLWKISEP